MHGSNNKEITGPRSQRRYETVEEYEAEMLKWRRLKEPKKAGSAPCRRCRASEPELGVVRPLARSAAASCACAAPPAPLEGEL
uniref:Uncharacterized protein n=1 Tax=Oryza punctata TaxID=4537 RepID=A0A0E0M7D4_ORYPU